MRVPLVEGWSARGLRSAISRAATSRGLTVETVEGEGFVAVRKVDEPQGEAGDTDGGATATRPATQASTAPRVRDRVVVGSDRQRELAHLQRLLI